MSFRTSVTAWFALSVAVIVAVLIVTAHLHLDEELRRDRWDRSHPKFPEWVIHGSFTNEEVHDILGELLHVWLGVGLPLVAASFLAGHFIARRSVRPIRHINRELARLSPASLDAGIRVPERDEELSELVRHINDLLVRIGRSYNEMSEFSARVAHELRTPLTLLRLRLEAAAPDLPPDFSEEVQEELRRLTNLVERSLLAAKAEGGRLEFTRTQVNFSALLEELRDGYSILATGKNLELEWRAPPSLGLRSDPGLLRQILHNLLGNCVRHGARRARLRVRAHPRGVLLTLSNFKPARQPAGEGNGLGLRLVRSLCAPLGCSLAIRQNRRVFSLRWILPSNGSLPRPRSVHSNRP